MVVAGDRTGTVNVEMRRVALREHGFAGLWIDDQVNNPPTSVSLRMLDSEISGNNVAGLGEELDFSEILGQVAEASAALVAKNVSTEAELQDALEWGRNLLVVLEQAAARNTRITLSRELPCESRRRTRLSVASVFVRNCVREAVGLAERRCETRLGQR